MPTRDAGTSTAPATHRSGREPAWVANEPAPPPPAPVVAAPSALDRAVTAAGVVREAAPSVATLAGLLACFAVGRRLRLWWTATAPARPRFVLAGGAAPPSDVGEPRPRGDRLTAAEARARHVDELRAIALRALACPPAALRVAEDAGAPKELRWRARVALDGAPPVRGEAASEAGALRRLVRAHRAWREDWTGYAVARHAGR